MYKFYDTDGNKVDEEEFIQIYNNCYYIDGGKKIHRVVKSSRYVEDIIEDILKRGIQSKLDVAHILAWKIGKIKHAASEKKQGFVYASDWQGAEHLNVTRYGKPFDLSEIAKYIVNNIDRLEKEAVSDPQGVLNKLRDENIAGIGTVYLITLIYFLSRGKYPIYDRFASIAIDAIKTGKNPGSKIDYHPLPAKNTEKFEHVFEENMFQYKQNIKEVFGNTKIYKNNPADRRIDRALWVYGHQFSYTKKN